MRQMKKLTLTVLAVGFAALQPFANAQFGSGIVFDLKMWWPGTELNRRRQPFQGCALPPELPGHVRNPRIRRGPRDCLLHADGRQDCRRKQHQCSSCGTMSIIATESNSLNGDRAAANLPEAATSFPAFGSRTAQKSQA